MGAKRALIVDDSKSARLFLSRILEQYAIDVESVESAEAAIDYLATHHPDVVFMDHQMPGMDGLQAVKLIKNNPVTATIPIMMYTSQEGELYLGQARALGAVGVLPKQIKQADVSKVLYELHLLPDRRRSGTSAEFRPVTLDALADAAVAAEQTMPAVYERGESALREHFAELRRSLVASIETQSDRIVADFHAALRDAPMYARADAPSRREPNSAWAIAALALAVALASGILWWREASLRQQLVTQMATLRASQMFETARANEAARTAKLSDAVDTPTVGAADAAQPVPTAAPRKSARRALANGVDKPIVAAVPYGEEALGGARLETIRQLFHRLIGERFSGVVDVRTFAGRFCLVGNATDGYSLAPDELPVARCDVVGNPREELQDPSLREPLDFANLVGELRSSTRGGAEVRVSAGDAAAALVPYPPSSPELTAGEWNRAASLNNRVEIRLR